MKQKILTGILILFISDTAFSQPEYDELTFATLGRVRYKAPDGFKEGFNLPILSLSYSVVRENMYGMIDVTGMVHGLKELATGKSSFTQNSSGNEGTDMVVGMIALGDNLISRDDWQLGGGITLDLLRVNTFRSSNYPDQEMSAIGLMLNTAFLYRINSKIRNFFTFHAGPTFTNRGATPIDGYQFFMRNSFSFGSESFSICISPEARYYRTLSNTDELWTANTFLIHFGFSWGI